MLFGIDLPCGGACADPRFLAELAGLAESSGWDGVFLEDYIVYSKEPDCPSVDVWVALAAMALATTRVRLGTAVTAAPRRRPWKLAREVTTLDHLSGGRVTLGLGAGDPAPRRTTRLSTPPTSLAQATCGACASSSPNCAAISIISIS
jgi:alkanesulfonate monooxygenase SsuD/methylene tetrahydromethanopterin reductase-like flavin-dependent oxidoreductase (luciferase family)